MQLYRSPGLSMSSEDAGLRATARRMSGRLTGSPLQKLYRPLWRSHDKRASKTDLWCISRPTYESSSRPIECVDGSEGVAAPNRVSLTSSRYSEASDKQSFGSHLTREPPSNLKVENGWETGNLTLIRNVQSMMSPTLKLPTAKTNSVHSGGPKVPSLTQEPDEPEEPVGEIAEAKREFNAKHGSKWDLKFGMMRENKRLSSKCRAGPKSSPDNDGVSIFKRVSITRIHKDWEAPDKYGLPHSGRKIHLRKTSGLVPAGNKPRTSPMSTPGNPRDQSQSTPPQDQNYVDHRTLMKHLYQASKEEVARYGRATGVPKYKESPGTTDLRRVLSAPAETNELLTSCVVKDLIEERKKVRALTQELALAQTIVHTSSLEFQQKHAEYKLALERLYTLHKRETQVLEDKLDRMSSCTYNLQPASVSSMQTVMPVQLCTADSNKPLSTTAEHRKSLALPALRKVLPIG